MIAMKLDELTLQMNNIGSNIENYILEQEYSRQYEKLWDNFDRIGFLYNETRRWAKSEEKNKTWDLQSRTNQMISLDSDYPQSITPHHELFSLYKQIIYTEVQSMAAMAFAYMWRNENDKAINELNEVKMERIKSIIEYTSLFKNKMKIARNFIRRCEANYKGNKNMIGNKTYASFNNMFHTIVLFREHFEPTDTITEWEIPDPFRLCQIHNDCDDEKHRYDDICPGWIINCRRALTIEYCQRNEEDQTSTKKYYWMIVRNLEKSMNFGNTNHACEPFSFHRMNIFHTDYIKNIQIPVYCDCIDDSIYTRNKTIRGLSLLWSQTSDNMVATGARLVAQDRMIHIQLREGKLLPYGEIDKKTERWIPLPTFEYYENFPNVAIDSNGKRHSLSENIDFVSIHHLYARTICLQKLTIDEEHLLTGVRFNYEYLGKGLERRFKLEVKYVGFNYQYGNITTERKYEEKSCRKLPELILNNPDDPLKFNTHPHDSKEDQFITIRASDLIKDASQSTIPFFDLSEIAPETSLPITGIELFHKGQIDGTSGGYVSLKIYPINLTMYMNPPLLPDTLNIQNITIPEFGLQNS
ncbi:uncharacterized protein LOC122860604 [Aphidius gifuensis]|uniref:uncharacterized protein LOC122860604 n=1 Tax=Aphidius gifuensis TaxID=684658 RepID=UPI001CDCCCD8|nr:uncharacterized protein LOC122860604 [Aphidius gifuensis]